MLGAVSKLLELAYFDKYIRRFQNLGAILCFLMASYTPSLIFKSELVKSYDISSV